MQRETMEIRAVWKERPSWFASGMMQWVAEAVGPNGAYRAREAPAFPLDATFVAACDPDGSDGYIRVVRDQMDAEQRKIVEVMLADFVAALEREGWVRTGQGNDWYNLHFDRASGQS